MYRIKPLGSYIQWSPLLDGTFLITGNVKCFISILENKAIQKLYDTDIEEFILQLCDERILCKSSGNLCIYEKDNNGIFKKKVSKPLPSLSHYKQIRDNVIVARDIGRINFFDANTLEITDYIKYDVWQEYKSKMGMITENLLVIRSKEPYRQYALIDINEKEIEELVLDDESNYVDPETGELCGKTKREPNIVDIIDLPDCSVYVETWDYVLNMKSSYTMRWNKNKKDFDGAGMPYFQNERNRMADTFLIKLLENGDALFEVTISQNQKDLYLIK